MESWLYIPRDGQVRQRWADGTEKVAAGFSADGCTDDTEAFINALAELHEEP